MNAVAAERRAYNIAFRLLISVIRDKKVIR
jgi:hypothetical protein